MRTGRAVLVFFHLCLETVFIECPLIHKAVVSMKLSEHKPHNMADCHVKINSGVMWKSSYVNTAIAELSCCASFERFHFACATRHSRQRDVGLEHC